MFETGMSALVLKICSEYAKSLGLNFPPCTQQEINAICQWVDKHTIKDMTISQNGYDVTFTFKTENDTTKEFTFTIPKKVDIDELEKVLVGSETVVVERTEDNSKLQVRLAQSVTDNINSKLTKPANPTSDSVVTMNASGTVGTKPLSEIGGGKLYKHYVGLVVEKVAASGEVQEDYIIGFTYVDTFAYKHNRTYWKNLFDRLCILGGQSAFVLPEPFICLYDSYPTSTVELSFIFGGTYFSTVPYMYSETDGFTPINSQMSGSYLFGSRTDTSETYAEEVKEL